MQKNSDVDHVRHVSSPPTEGEVDHVSRQSQPRAHVSGSRGHVDHVRHVSSPPTEGEADHVSRQSQPRAHVSGSRGLVEKRLRSPRVIPRSLKRQTTCAILRIRHVGHTREPREPDEGRVDARGRHEPEGSKWGETRRLLDTCAMSKRGQMLVSTREPRVEALSQVGHLSAPPPGHGARAGCRQSSLTRHG